MRILLLLTALALLWASRCGSLASADDNAPAQHTNRLADESSPYLLQHAHNPVDWFPWGEEAFERAQRENKLIFLSVGYSSCHWCHVMERESFMDAEIAALMNDNFVCVKVDREERPDVDQIYMMAVQILTRGSGGWPMSVFILPDGRPFWGGSYFPARTGDRGEATGFLSILKQITTVWRERKNAVERQADSVTDAIRRTQRQYQLDDAKKVAFDRDLVDSVAAALRAQYDMEFGGFGYSVAQPNRPKFPEPSNLVFLLDRAQRESAGSAQREQAKEMLLRTLDGMISGATFDHLGGGFHRYSVDRRWQIPHFEKMLYDNGQLASVYALAYALTERGEYRYVAESICDFAIREFRDQRGGFYSAIDADSGGEEGAFYRWLPTELEDLRQIDGFADFAAVYRLDQQPNFEDKYLVPAPGQTLTAIAATRGTEFDQLADSLGEVRQRLFELRRQRPRPATDEKILAAWNGLMISGLADTGRVLNRSDYINIAIEAAEFVLREMRGPDGRLKRGYAAGKAQLDGYLDDYAFMAAGCLSLYQATGNQDWLDAASELTDQQIELFWDDEFGGFYYTASDQPSLIIRLKDPVDSALPSGISVAAANLLTLSAELDQEGYAERAAEMLRSVAPVLDRLPAAAPRSAAALAEYLDTQAEDR